MEQSTWAVQSMNLWLHNHPSLLPNFNRDSPVQAFSKSARRDLHTATLCGIPPQYLTAAAWMDADWLRASRDVTKNQATVGVVIGAEQIV